MTISQIYQQFQLPPNLIHHHLRVAQVALFIYHHWTGPKLDKHLLTQVCLLHDLGNIAKFNFKKHPEFLGSEAKNIKHWQDVQQQVIKKYGSDDHLATTQMLDEIKAEPKIRMILEKIFTNFPQIAASQNCELMILAYSDSRVGPFGIIALKDRIDEVLSRSQTHAQLPNLNQLIDAAYQIESQIQANLIIPVSQIAGQLVSQLTPTHNLLNISITNN